MVTLQDNKYKISASADGGPRSWVCARLTLRSAPIDTRGNFSTTVSRGGQFWFEKIDPQGGRGEGPPHFFPPQIVFFYDLKPHSTFHNPTITPCGRKVTQHKTRLLIPLAPMGVLASGSAHARPSAQPPSSPAEICWRRCLQSHFQTSLATPLKSYPKFQNSRTTFENTPLCLPNIA